jgi:lipoteichoic acid synthase
MWDVLLFAAIIFLKAINLNFVMGLKDKYSFIFLVLGVIGSVLILVSIGCLFKNKARVIFLFILDFLVSLILLTDIVYNRYFSDVTSVALIKQAGLVGEVGDSVQSLLHLSDILYFIDFPVLIFIFIMIRRNMSFKEALSAIQRTACFAVVFILGLSLSYVSARALDKNQPGILRTLYDKKYIVKNIGDINFHGFDIYRYVNGNLLKRNKISDEEKQDIKKWYDDKNSVSNQKYYGSMEGKNLIVVQLESFQGFVLNRSVNGQEITPNLNKLSKESLVFDNYYYETAWGGTSDAEFLSNVSLLPYRDGSVYYQYAGNTYDSLISSLKSKGYFTAVMHANRPGFWNRVQMYKSLGFDKFESQDNFKQDEKLGMGLSDESFFKQGVQKMKNYDKPFYSFLISLTSHFPFKDGSGKIEGMLDAGPYEGELIGDYMKAARYTDYAIGEFIKALKAEGLWDNSVVVFYGDHASIPYEHRDQLAKLLYNKNDLTPLEWFNAQKVVSLIHFPNEEIKGHSTMTAGEMDLYPTLANLFGVKYSYALGRDLLNSKDGFMVTRDRGWADNNVAYVQSIDKVLDIKTGKELNKDDYAAQFEKAQKFREISDKTIENNLIHYFREKLGK